MAKQITIIGCGVIGLTTGIRLLERSKLPVTIIAKDFPPNTTSNIAAAIWLPFLVAPADKAEVWCKRSFDVFCEQTTDPQTGVFMTELFEFFPDQRESPFWVRAIRNYRPAEKSEIPPGYQSGIVAEVPLIETPIHMKFLVEQFQQLGGKLIQQSLGSIDEVTHGDSIIINCSGLGAKELAKDENMFPIRGQIARMEKIDSSTSFTVEEGPHAISYVLPRQNDTIVGGTAIRHQWNLDIDEKASGKMIADAQFFEPELIGKKVLEQLVGLRPGRTEIRLESEIDQRGNQIIHNYGHGGAGFTLCWGCAESVCELLQLN